MFTDEESLLNADLLSSGLASVYVETPCYFHQYFVTLEVAARSESRRMWTTPMNSSIVIRQIFNDGRTEYVELWNRSDQTVNLSGWSISWMIDETGLIFRSLLRSRRKDASTSYQAPVQHHHRPIMCTPQKRRYGTTEETEHACMMKKMSLSRSTVTD